ACGANEDQLQWSDEIKSTIYTILSVPEAPQAGAEFVTIVTELMGKVERLDNL
ncbi:unnamed protein product, partial [Ascophyllum nodosum]